MRELRFWRAVPVLVSAMMLPAADRLTFERIVVDPDGPMDLWLKSAGDLNGDHRPDLVAGGRRDGGLVWYENPSWTKRVIAAKDLFSTDGEVADVDRDGDNDVVAVTTRQIIWYENPSWTAHTIADGVVHDIEVGDLDGDGRLDVVARNQGAFSARGDTLFLYRQESPGKWTPGKVEVPDGEGLRLADIDGDRDLDIVINRLWLENPGWERRTYGPGWDYPHTFVAAADFSGDSRPDIILSPAEKAGSMYRISWFEAPRDPKAGRWTEHTVEDPVEAVHHYIGAADFDGDRRIDIVTARMQQGKDPEIAVYLNGGAGKRWLKSVVAHRSSHSMRILDFDGDGRPDLYGADWRGSRVVELWRNVTAPASGPRR